MTRKTKQQENEKNLKKLIQDIKKSKISVKLINQKNKDNVLLEIDINKNLQDILKRVILKNEFEDLRLILDNSIREDFYRDTLRNEDISNSEIIDYLDSHYRDAWEIYDEDGLSPALETLPNIRIIERGVIFKRHKVFRIYYSALNNNYGNQNYKDLIFTKDLIKKRKICLELTENRAIGDIKRSLSNAINELLNSFSDLDTTTEYTIKLEKNGQND